MVFKVPQFIEVEDKIFGPLTFKQFVYVVGGAGLCFILWSVLPKLIAVLFILPSAAFALCLAFFQVNNRPFVIIVEAFIKYQLSGKLYLWRHNAPKAVNGEQKKQKIPEKILSIPTLSGSKLHDLAWSLDVNETLDQ